MTYTVFTRKKNGLVRWVMKGLSKDRARMTCLENGGNSTGETWEFTTDRNYVSSYGTGKEWRGGKK